MKRLSISKLIVLFFISFLYEYDITLAQPVNDEPCDAIALTVGSSCSFNVYTNFDATASGGVPAPGCANYLGGDVWFTITVPAGGNLTFDSNTGVITDGGMAIYSGSCGSLTLISCNDDASANGLMPMISSTGLTVGSTIWIRFWEYGNNNNGTFSICVWQPPPPPGCNPTSPNANNLCGSATLVNLCQIDGLCKSTSGFTADQPGNLGTIFCGSIENNSWFKFVATSTSLSFTVTPSNCSSTSGIQVHMFSTPDCNTFTSVSNCYNPFSTTPGTITSTALTIGQTYYIMIDGNGGAICDYQFDISPNPVCFDCSTTPMSVSTTASPTFICSGSSSTLLATPTGGTGPYTYSWSPATGLSSTTVASPTATPAVTTIYTITVTDANACIATNTVTVTVSTLTATATASPLAVCSGKPSNLTTTVSGGTAPYTYSWSPATGLSATNISNPVATPVVTTTYTVNVTDAAGCIKSSSVTITVTAGPTATFTISPSPMCIGSTVTITYTGTGSPTDIYMWNFGGGTVISGSGQGPYVVSWPSITSPSSITVTLLVTTP